MQSLANDVNRLKDKVGGINSTDTVTSVPGTLTAAGSAASVLSGGLSLPSTAALSVGSATTNSTLDTSGGVQAASYDLSTT